MKIIRRPTRVIYVGNVPVGGNNPIVIQSMTKANPSNFKAILEEINNLIDAGCELVRVAIPDSKSLEVFHSLVREVEIPLIADIHFNWKLAIAAIEAGASGIRINPGNIGGINKFREILKNLTQAKQVALRIGINAGSLEKELLLKYKHPQAKALVESAILYSNIAEEAGFLNYKISLKSSDVLTTIKAYRMISALTSAPLHLGITEAGSELSGIVKSSIGIGSLLLEGIGDTIRVSLSAPSKEEVSVAKEILRSLHLYNKGVEVISCPTCGRCEYDLFSIVKKIKELTSNINTPYLKVAIMGCVVNGPGEASEADIGVAGGKGKGVLFKKGKIIRTITTEEIIPVIMEEINRHSVK